VTIRRSLRYDRKPIPQYGPSNGRRIEVSRIAVVTTAQVEWEKAIRSPADCWKGFVEKVIFSSPRDYPLEKFHFDPSITFQVILITWQANHTDRRIIRLIIHLYVRQ